MREFAGLILASLVAGLATTLYAAYHFHRLAPYGTLANLLAMPVVSAAVMPMGILGVVAMPFGYDSIFWRLMGDGIDWMIRVSLWVASLPGAVGRMQAFGTGPLLAGTAGLLVICLLRSPLRWSGAIIALAAGLWAVFTPRADVLVAGDGQSAAFRGPDGRLAVLHSGRDSFAVKEWLAADADERMPKDPSLASGVTCDAIGCIGRLADGRLISVVFALEAFGEDCTRAAVVVSAREAMSPNCGPRWLIEMRGAPTVPWLYAGPATDSSKLLRFPRTMTARGGAACPMRLKIHGHPRRPDQAMPRRAQRLSKRKINSAGTNPPIFLGYGRGWEAKSAPRRPYWPAQAQLRRRGGGNA